MSVPTTPGPPGDHGLVARAVDLLIPPPAGPPPPAGHGFVAGALAGGRHFYHQVLEFARDRPYVPIGVVLLCLASAACYAASSVLQQREARRAPAGMAMRWGLIGHLVRRP